ncbi:MAG: sulfurtransferase [Deltaproteobacteria bacterium]|nr:sulfurtransferase [Deltaproteobacteria bacterium]
MNCASCLPRWRPWTPRRRKKRQPWEYETAHLPGAKLVPLGQLKDALEELDKDKPTLVYCAIGGRSRVAAQLLSGLGFREVYNLAGGIRAYQGLKAAGPWELNLDLVRGDESPQEMLALAFGLEKALQIFYDTVRERARDQDLVALLTKLSQMEEIHQRRIWERYQVLEPQADLAAFAARVNTDIVEGGYNLQEFLARNQPLLQTVTQVLEVAMMTETQALDLYLRLAQRSRDQAARDLLLALAEEEKAHLAALGRLLDEKRPPAPASRAG